MIIVSFLERFLWENSLNACLFKKAWVIEIERFLNWEAWNLYERSCAYVHFPSEWGLPKVFRITN